MLTQPACSDRMRCSVVRWIVVLAMLVVSTTFEPRAAAQSSDSFCEKVRARAASDAALLFSPQLVLQGLHFAGFVDLTSTLGNTYQIRIGLAFSPIDAVRGARRRQVADAACGRHEIALEIEEIVQHGEAAARLLALRDEVAFLELHRDEWQALLTRAEERVASRVITLMEFNEFRRNVDEIEQKLVLARSEIVELEASGANRPVEPVDGLADAYVRESMAIETEEARLRRLDPWETRIVGGLVPSSAPDWYGLIDVRFNFGAFAHRNQEQRYLAARAEELRHAPYELVARLEEFVGLTRTKAEETTREVEEVDRRIAFLTRTRGFLESSDASNVAHARDSLAVEQRMLEAHRAFLQGLVTAFSAYSEDEHGR